MTGIEDSRESRSIRPNWTRGGEKVSGQNDLRWAIIYRRSANRQRGGVNEKNTAPSDIGQP